MKDAGVSRETCDLLRSFLDDLLLWNQTINLVSARNEKDLWERHILDSLQIYDLAPQGWRSWVDMGTGAGLPGLVVAIAARARGDQGSVTLIESDERKCAFLTLVNAKYDLGARILRSRIEATEPIGADIVSARALGPLDRLLGFAYTHMVAGGTAIFPKGRTWKQEIEDAQTRWTFEVEPAPSQTSPDSAILLIRTLKPNATSIS